MELLLVGFIWILNLVISFWNAYASGKVWAETKSVGGWKHFMTWMGAIMSASGFTWCYLLVLVLSAHFLGFLGTEHVGIGLQLGYLIIVPGILFAGLMITIDSWARAYREGGILNYGVAGYNTYAQIHNTMGAINNYGAAFGSVFEFFTGGKKGSSSSSSSDDDAKGAAALLLIFLVILAVIGGVLTTVTIIKKVSASDRLISLEELRERARLQGRA